MSKARHPANLVLVTLLGLSASLGGCSEESSPIDPPGMLLPHELCANVPASTIATFGDVQLEAAVRSALSAGPETALTCGLIGTVVSLTANSVGMSSLLGAQNLTGLVELRIAYNAISDASPLGDLPLLAVLDLHDNQVSDVGPIGRITTLVDIDLDYNGITNILPLVGLTDLTNLYLTGNSLTDISAIGALTELVYLDLRQNVDLTNIQPLFDNPGIGANDRVLLQDTNVACPDVNTLRGMGVLVSTDCP